MDFSGKTAFVTGAANGIGQATAKAFGAAGANVAVTDLGLDMLEETKALVEATGARCEAIVADVTDKAQVIAAVAKTVSLFGKLDCAHNNAGFFPDQAEVTEASEEEARKAMEINFWGVFHGMRAQIEVMLGQGGGTIVNTSSGAGLFGFPQSAVYCASKHAVVGYSRSAALDYASRNIRINVVCPGIIETKMVTSLIGTEESHAAMAALHPIGRVGQVQEVADAVLWLSSPGAGFVVGTCLSVDGGASAQ